MKLGGIDWTTGVVAFQGRVDVVCVAVDEGNGLEPVGYKGGCCCCIIAFELGSTSL